MLHGRSSQKVLTSSFSTLSSISENIPRTRPLVLGARFDARLQSRRPCLFIRFNDSALTWVRWVYSGRISCVKIREMVKAISFNLTSSRGGVTATEDGDESRTTRLQIVITVIFNVILTRRRVDRDRRRVDIDDDGWFSSRSSRFVEEVGCFETKA